MDDWVGSDIPPEDAMQESSNQDLIKLLQFLLEEAQAGQLDGFTGAFLIAPDDEDDKPAVGMVASHKMENLKYVTVGALEKIKNNLLTS
jgi:hypothetical protein